MGSGGSAIEGVTPDFSKNVYGKRAAGLAKALSDRKESEEHKFRTEVTVVFRSVEGRTIANVSFDVPKLKGVKR